MTNLLCCRLVMIFLIGSTMMSCSKKTDAREGQKQKQILSLDKIIELPAASSSAAWSPDGKKLLVDLPYLFPKVKNIPWTSAAYLIDVETGKLGEPFDALHNGLDHFYWSPDGKYIAVTRIQSIRLLTYPGFKEVGVMKYEKNCYHQSKFGAAFIPDSRGLWVACQRRGSKGYGPKTYTAAVKVSIPEMKVIKHFMAPHPREGVEFLSGFGNIYVQGDKVLLSARLDTERSRFPYGSANYNSSFLVSYDLEAGKPFHRSGSGNLYSCYKWISGL